MRGLALAGLALLVGCSGPAHEAGKGGAPPADRAREGPSGHRLFVGPKFWTGAADVAAIEVDAAGLIVAVHKEMPAWSGARVELPGKLAVPGLHDAHIHLAGVGRRADQADLRGATSPAEVVERLRAWAAGREGVAVIVGRGWDQTRFADKAFPTWRDLAALGDTPVVLTRVDGHALWANKAMLDAAGVTKATRDPEGGRILRFEDGAPTGVLVDNAMGLVRKQLPAASGADVERWLRAGAALCADAGLTAVHDMGMGLDTLAALRRIDAAEPLPLRVFVHLAGTEDASVEWLSRHPAPARVSPRIEVRGVKLFADGALGSRGAALLEPYDDEPHHSGLLLHSPERLRELVLRVDALGHQVAVHAIGDRGVRVTLDAFAAAREGGSTARHRVEHAQVVHRDDFDRFRRLKIIASMQPTHATSDMRWAEARVGDERLEGAYAWAEMLSRGVYLVFGSDAPIESERPALGLYAATTRMDDAGEPPEGWLPEQKVGFADAVAAFAGAAAYAVGREDELGELWPGKRFDLTVFDEDPSEDPTLWLETRAMATVVDGRVRLRAGAP